VIRRLLAALALGLGAGLTAPAQAEPIAVDGGQVEGTTLPSGVAAWLGVPLAAPPLRDLRWKPPQPVVPWQGTLHADRFAPECLQPLRGSLQNHYFGNEATSEDCLPQHLGTGQGGQGAGGGVDLWRRVQHRLGLHGQLFGRADGARRVVRVNIAYRVGALGFLAHPALSAESGHGSGNYGLMDQIAALQWIKRNIARFGGDPDNVTIGPVGRRDVGRAAATQPDGARPVRPRRGDERQSVWRHARPRPWRRARRRAGPAKGTGRSLAGRDAQPARRPRRRRHHHARRSCAMARW
jgi:para-nitrobenzyl esterase